MFLPSNCFLSGSEKQAMNQRPSQCTDLEPSARCESRSGEENRDSHLGVDRGCGKS